MDKRNAATLRAARERLFAEFATVTDLRAKSEK